MSFLVAIAERRCLIACECVKFSALHGEISAARASPSLMCKRKEILYGILEAREISLCRAHVNSPLETVFGLIIECIRTKKKHGKGYTVIQESFNQ